MSQSSNALKLVYGEVEGEDLVFISFSKMQDWSYCQRKAYYRYHRGLQKKTRPKPLERGALAHDAFEAMYRGEDWKAVLLKYKREVYDKMLREEQDYYGNLPQEIYNVIKRYLLHYGNEPLYVEKYKGKPMVEVEFVVRIPNTNVVLKGRIDLVIRDSYGLWVMDHKFSDSEPSLNYQMVDAQVTLYYWVLSLFPEFKDLQGIIFNGVRTKVPSKPELTQKKELSQKNIDTDEYTVVRELKKLGLDPADHFDYIQKVTRGRVWFHRQPLRRPEAMVNNALREVQRAARQMASSIKAPIRNMSKICEKNCEFYDLCWAELQGLDTKTLLRLNYEQKEERH